MSELGNSFKTLIENYENSTRPTDFYFATMVTSNQIQLDNSAGPIPAVLCIVPEWCRTGDNPVRAGDRVVVLQKRGGQKYLVLGRL